jgi:hypothetical protein
MLIVLLFYIFPNIYAYQSIIIEGSIIHYFIDLCKKINKKNSKYQCILAERQ